MSRVNAPILARVAGCFLLAVVALVAPASSGQLIISDAPRMDIRVDLRVGRTWIYRTRAEHTRTLRRPDATTTERRASRITWFARATRAIDRDTVEVRASIVLLDLSASNGEASLDLSARNPALATLYSIPGRVGVRTRADTPLDRALAGTTFRFRVDTGSGVARLVSIEGPLPRLLGTIDKDGLGIGAPLDPGAVSSTFSAFWDAESMLADHVRLNAAWRVQRTSGAAPAGRLVWTYAWRLKGAASAFAIMEAGVSAQLVQTWHPRPGDSATLRHAAGSVTTLWDTAGDALAERNERRASTMDWTIGGRTVTETQTHAHRIERRG